MTAGVSPSASVWSIIRHELAHAPPKARRAVWIGIAGEAMMVVFAIVDTITGSPGDEPFRLIGFVLTAFGLLLHTIVQALRCSAASRPPGSAMEAGTLRFHRVLLVLPTLAVIATASAALAAGLMIPSVGDDIEFVFFPFIPGALAVIAALELLAVSRFLYEEAERRGRRAETAESEAADARLAALQAQMNPHFLFNTLNTVASLIRTNGPRAERTVEHLADVLRRTLERSTTPTCSLREELDYLQAYLGIETERWGDALSIEWRVAPDTLEVHVPTMSLQPLVENALVHGIGANIDGGRIRIETNRSNGRVTLSVADTGPGWSPHAREGTGLGNLRRRLATIYGDEARLAIDSAAGLTRVTIDIPVWWAEDADAHPDR